MAEAVRALMLSWLLSHNYAGYQAEAIIRNAWIESRLQPCIVARSGSSYLFQYVGSRKRKLQQMSGGGCPSVEAQLAFLDRELHSAAYSRFLTAPPHLAFAVFRRCYEHGRRC